MIRNGDMVKADSGPIMQFLHLDDDGMAACLVIDEHGDSAVRFVYPGHLKPMRDALQPRSRWPESGHLDLIEIEREERAAAEARKLQRRAARKAKRSNKLTRREPVMA